MKKFFSSKWLRALALCAVLVLVLLIPTHQAHALAGGCVPPGADLGKCISNGFYYVIYFLGLIAGLFIAVVLWIIQVILQFNQHVVDSTIVQTGFSVTLGFANLGFVLGIIIVALATILRRETYGIKTILWKIVMMAILVNFALVIAAPIIGFANGLTLYFVNAMPGGSNAAGGNGSGGFTNLASGMAGIFQPQRLIAPENAGNSFGSSGASGFNIGTQALASGLGAVLAGIVGVGMAAVTLVLIVIILLVLFVMLLIRYVYLEILLIMAPLAWMSWVFPKTSKYWSQWWDKFIAQAFFPPIAFFFIYLITLIGANIAPGQSVQVSPVGTGVGGFLASIGNGLFGTLISSALSSLLMIGLMLGGLSMAQKMATAGSEMAAKVVGKAKDSLMGYAGRKGKQAATAPLRTEKMRQRFQNWQQGGWLKRQTIGRFGAGLESAAVAGGEKNINENAAKGLTDAQKKGQLGRSDFSSRVAILESMKKEDLQNLSADEKERYFGKDTKAAYQRYGKRGSDLYKKFREDSGLQRKDLINEAEEKYQKALAAGDDESRKKLEGEMNDTLKELDALIRKSPEDAVGAFTNKEDREKALRRAEEDQKKTGKPIPDSVKIDEKSIKQLQAAVVGAMVRSTPENFNSFIKELNKKNNLKEFQEAIKGMKKDDSTAFQAIQKSFKENGILLASIGRKPSNVLINVGELFDVQKEIKDAVAKSQKGVKTKEEEEPEEETAAATPPPAP